jgi:hypothetical protein
MPTIKGPCKYECLLCRRQGFIRGANTPEDYCWHMKFFHQVEVEPKDIRWLEEQQANDLP